LSDAKKSLTAQTPRLYGTWVYSTEYYSSTYKFNDGDYESFNANYNGPYQKGSYTTDGDRLKWGKWSIYGGYFAALSGGLGAPSYYSAFESRWYSSKEYQNIVKEYGQDTSSDYTSVTTYAVSGNTLTLTNTTTKKSDGTVTTSSTTYTKM